MYLTEAVVLRRSSGNEEQLMNHIAFFPEGGHCVKVDGRIAGSITDLIASFRIVNPDHIWTEITDDGYIHNHYPDGNTLYIVIYASLNYGLPMEWMTHSKFSINNQSALFLSCQSFCDQGVINHMDF